MADVTGPISSMPNSLHNVPKGIMCDDHPTVPATRRVQGETDSMGSEMNDMCEACYITYKEEIQAHAAEASCGTCDWCKSNATDLRDRRDYDEGMSGPLYRVCGPCILKANDRDVAEIEYDDGWGEYSASDYDD